MKRPVCLGQWFLYWASVIALHNMASNVADIIISIPTNVSVGVPSNTCCNWYRFGGSTIEGLYTSPICSDIVRRPTVVRQFRDGSRHRKLGWVLVMQSSNFHSHRGFSRTVPVVLFLLIAFRCWLRGVSLKKNIKNNILTSNITFLLGLHGYSDRPPALPVHPHSYCAYRGADRNVRWPFPRPAALLRRKSIWARRIWWHVRARSRAGIISQRRYSVWRTYFHWVNTV